MKINECMSKDVRVVDPGDTVQDAARAMADIDAGVLPVGENDRLVGVITDRDIAVRGIGRGYTPEAQVRDIMSDEVLYCFADQEAGEVLRNMGEIQLRRMPVVDRDKRLVGIVSITDLAGNGATDDAGKALGRIAQPSALHSQTA